tara:strand:+ start:2772 stop:3233 length:462 start_codon:yes stop_codon:yes gene_type:complete
MAKVSQRQIVAEITPSDEIAPTPGTQDGNTYFAQAGGGEVTAAVEKVYDGGSRFPEVLCSVAEVGDITVTRHYDKVRDRQFLEDLRPLVGIAYYDVSFFEMDCDLKDASTMRIYNDALVVGLTEPDGDAASGAPASYSITFSVGQVAASTPTS